MFSFLQISSSNHSTHLDQIPTFILSSHQTLGPLSVLFPSNFFIKTLYTSRPKPHFNIILPSTPGSTKYPLSFKFLHQIPVQALTIFPTLILTSHQPLGTPNVLFPSDFFIKTLYTPRQNPQFNIILPSTPGPTKSYLPFRFLHQKTLHN